MFLEQPGVIKFVQECLNQRVVEGAKSEVKGAGNLVKRVTPVELLP